MGIFEEFAIASNMHVLADLHLPGEEAIAFQLNSRLGQRLTDLFQSVIDYRDNLDYSDVIDDPDIRSNYRKSRVWHYCVNTMSDGFEQIVKEELNFKIKKFWLYVSPAGPCGAFAVDLSFNDESAAVDVINTSTGTKDTSYTVSKQRVEDMRDLANHIDLEKSIITSSTYGSKSKPIEVNMYFDVNTAFLLRDFATTKLSEGNELTARELAAIMMHECGHVMTFIEHSDNVIVFKQRLEDYKCALRNASNVNELCTWFSDVALPLAQKLSTYNCSNKAASNLISSTGKQLVTAITKLKTAAASDNHADDDEDIKFDTRKPSVFATLKDKLTSFIIFVILEVILSLFLYHLLLKQVDGLGRLVSYADNYRGKRNSDYNVNYNNSFLLERWADEFVSRQGYGADLASGLMKFEVIFDRLRYGGGAIPYALRTSTLFELTSRFCTFILRILNPLEMLSSYGYEEAYDRIARMLQNQYAAFKKTNLPPQFVERSLITLEQLKKTVADRRTVWDTDTGKTVSRILKNFLTIPNLYQLIKNGRLDQDYELLQNRLDDISNNPLYADSYALKSKLRK